ncbi:MAG: tol-pal system-associated acyl-CoA thioesterase [Aeromonadaceae bacterium]
MSGQEFLFPIRVYYEDTDAGGIVYNANYLKFLERARTEWLSELGIEQDTWLTQGVAFVVRHINIDFRSAAKFNQRLLVRSRISEVKRASVIFEQSIEDESGRLIVSANVTIACVLYQVMKPTAFPDVIKGVFTSATHGTVVY